MRLAKVGSTEYQQTWRERTTPAGRLYWEHTAKLYPTRVSDFSGLPTPTVNSILEKDCPSNRIRILKTGALRKRSKQGVEGSLNWSQWVLAKGWLPTPKLALFWMGYPTEWLSCGERAMQSSRKSPRSSSSPLKKLSTI